MIKDLIDKNETVKVNDKEMAVLKENFPSCFDKDGKFDIVKFQEVIKDKVDITKEGYELNFLGKSYAKLLASIETTTVIKPDLEHNNKPENKNSENIYISGDNLDALKHLAKSYAGLVKCIYIDPPYNTGSDGFVYNDKFEFSVDDLVQKLSVSEEEATRILDLTKRGSASHSAWLTFLYPRLLLARDMLKDDGVIFISIDDNEQSNLKVLCDYVFGEDCFEGNIHYRRRLNQPNDKTKLIGLVAEHLLVYAKDSGFLKKVGVGKVALTASFSNPDNDSRGDWASKPWKTGSDQSGTRYSIKTPSGKILTEEWMGDENTYNYLLADNRIIFPRNGDGMPRKKYFKSEREEEGQCATNWWTPDLNGDNASANAELEELFGNKNIFSNPKHTKLIQDIIGLANCKSKDIILDFFSGSATSAHSSMLYSMFERIQYILVQLPEKVKEGSIAESEGFKTIDEIGQKRIELAARKIREENHEADESFEQNSMLTDNNLLNEFGKETVLTTWLNDDGYGLTCTPQEIDLAGYKAYYMGKHLYLLDAEFNNEAQKALFEKYSNEPSFNPENIVLFGYSFSKWTILESLQTNLRQLPNKKINFDIRY